MFGVWLKIKNSDDSWRNVSCGFPSGQTRGAPQSRFARGGLTIAQRKLTFPDALGAGELPNVSYPHPNPGLLDLRNGF